MGPVHRASVLLLLLSLSALAPLAAQAWRGRVHGVVLGPEAHRRGRYRTAFAERSPRSDPAAVVPLYGGTAEDLGRLDPEARYQLAEETFEVYAPEGYAPAGAGGAPAYGLLVWVSPTRAGGVERPELQALLDERRLLWVGANAAGNPRSTLVRAGLALDAARAMTELYDLDPERIYVAGYSGGGRMASQLAMLFPEVFRGEEGSLRSLGRVRISFEAQR